MIRKLRSRLGLLRGKPGIFAAAFQRRDDAGPIEAAFGSHSGRFVTKWQQYLPVYDRLFAPYRSKPTKMLEIGVSKGGSLELWRGYFGEDATIFGIDIDPACAAFDGEAAQVRIGSQDDPAFLKSVASEMGSIDIVLDDGSHASSHMQTSFETLFPLLSDGGIYVVEDTQCCYWGDYGGGYRKKSSFIEFAKRTIDDMHRWYHPFPGRFDDIRSVQFFDGMIVFEKGAARKPRLIESGTRRSPK